VEEEKAAHLVQGKVQQGWRRSVRAQSLNGG